MLKALATTLSVRTLAFAASAAAHVAVFAATAVAGTHGPSAVGIASAGEISVEVLPPTPEAPPPVDEPEPPKVAHVNAATPPTHTHPYPVPQDHDAVPHDPAIEHPHAPAASEAAPALTADTAPIAHFSMTVGGASDFAGGRASAAGIASPPSPVSAPAPEGDANGIVDESGVSKRAHAVLRPPASYPYGSEELEADVTLEIVVGSSGTVETARVLHGAGNGFDGSALSAIKRYRFTPAERAGRPVRVRMAWVVSFRREL